MKRILLITLVKNSFIRSRAFRVFLTFLFINFPFPLYACPVCFVGKEGTTAAYLGTAIGLSLLPLGMVAAFSLWIYRRYRNNDCQEDHLPGHKFVSSGRQPTPMD